MVHQGCRLRSSLIILGVIIFLAGCNLPSTTLTPLPVSPAPIASPTALVPSATFVPTATASPQVQSIVFAPGTTAALAQGTVQPGEVVKYTLQADASQALILILVSQREDATLGVFMSDGSMLLDPSKKWNRVQWLLPENDTYTIEVIGGAAAESYELTVKVAELIDLPFGATKIVLNGTTLLGYIFSYSLVGQANQKMTVSLNVPSTAAYLDVFGIASSDLLDPSAKANSWSGTLPRTQAYIIEVLPADGQVVNYSLTVTLQ
jgi:hypothetical protein